MKLPATGLVPAKSLKKGSKIWRFEEDWDDEQGFGFTDNHRQIILAKVKKKAKLDKSTKIPPLA